ATDLRNREIVLSKLLSRLAMLTLIVLTGLPILSILQFLGGIDPNLLLAGFAGTFLTMFGLAGFSIFASVHFTTPRDEVLFSYLGPVAYVLVGLLGVYVKSTRWPWVAAPSTWGSFSVSLADAIDIYNSGNLPLALMDVWRSLGSWQMTNVLATTLRSFAMFH